MPGLALAVVKDDQVIHLRGYGYRDLERKLPVTPQTVFAIGSVTKSFTVVALGALVQQGKLDWDEPIRTYLPDFQLQDSYAAERMTARDLVTHRSGLPGHNAVWYLWEGSGLQRRDYYQRLRYLQPSAAFRSRWQYNNLTFTTAGYLAEQIAGVSWDELTEREVFEPLEMKASSTVLAGLEQASERASGYRRDDRGEIEHLKYANIDAGGPCGSINSSLEDMSHYLRALMSGGKWQGRQVFDAYTLREMTRPQMITPEMPKDSELGQNEYGMGLMVNTYRNHPQVGHGGNIDGFTAYIAWLPQDRIGIVMLSNLNRANQFRLVLSQRIFDLLLNLEPIDWSARYAARTAKDKAAAAHRELDSRKPGTRPAHALSEYVGEYEHPAYGTVRIAQSGDGLSLAFHGLSSALRHFHYETFEVVADQLNRLQRDQKSKVIFNTGPNGEVQSVSARFEAESGDIVFARRSEAQMRAVAQPQSDDLFLLASISQVRAAPGGAALAVMVSRPDPVSDTRVGEMHVITRIGETKRTDVLRNASFPQWSMDGATLYHVAKENGTAVLRAYGVKTKEVSVLARMPHAPTRLAWSPDQTRIAYIAEVPVEAQKWFDLPPSPPTAHPPILIDHPMFRSEENDWLPHTEPRLFVLDVKSGESHSLVLPEGSSLVETEGGDGGAPAWSADGQSILVSVARRFDARHQLWNVNRDLLSISVADGASRWIAQAPVIESDPGASPDGRYLAFRRQHGDPDATVFSFDLVLRDLRTGREWMPLPDLDRLIEGFTWAPDSRSIVLHYLDRGRFKLVKVPLRGIPTTISEDFISPALGSTSADVTADGSIAFVRSSPALPPEAVVVDKAGRLTEWTSFNSGIRSRNLSSLVEREYRSANPDGRMIHALVAIPPGAADISRLPVIVDLHGGPYWTSSFNFNLDREFFASQGYVVVQPNYRGSRGYGIAFQQLSDRKKYPGYYDQPELPIEMGLDVVGVLRAIAEQKLGDPNRVFLRGVSAGALLTTWTLGRTDGFKAAVAQSWYSGEWSAPFYGSYQIRRYFDGPPWDPEHQPEYWRRQSIMLADRIVTPLLIQQGEDDGWTPLMEAEKFFYALRTLGREVNLAVFPDEIHGIRRHPAGYRNSRAMELSWFRRHDPGVQSLQP